MKRERQDRIGRIFCGILVSLILAAGGLSTATQAADPPALEGLKGPERKRVANLIEGARKEGQVIWLSHSVDPEIAVRLEKGFREHYGLGDFRLRHSLMRTGPLSTRVLQEVRAGVRDIDIVHTSDFELFRDLHKRNLFLKYDSPEFARYDPVATRGEGGVPSASGYFTSAILTYFDVAYNTNHVKELRTYEDILDPRYRGRIVVGDASKSASHLFTYLGLRQKLPRQFWEKLAKQEPALIVPVRDMINRVGAGEYWIGFFVTARHIYLGAKRGLPVAAKPIQAEVGVVPVGYIWGILSSSPHPKAAKLLTDYFHSHKVQEMLVKAMAYTPSRLDVGVPPDIGKFARPLKEIPTLIPIPWKTLSRKELQQHREEFREIFFRGR